MLEVAGVDRMFDEVATQSAYLNSKWNSYLFSFVVHVYRSTAFRRTSASQPVWPSENGNAFEASVLGQVDVELMLYVCYQHAGDDETKRRYNAPDFNCPLPTILAV